MQKLGAIVLCGGESRRMGQPKAWLPFLGEPLLQRVVRQAREAVKGGPVLVAAAVGQDLPELPEVVSIVRDAEPAGGPLRGIVDGLRAMPEAVELVFVTATDMPFLAEGWVDRLATEIEGYDAAMPFERGVYPLGALYRRRTVLPAAEALLRDKAGPSALAERVNCRRVPLDDLRTVDAELWTLRNVNTWEEYEAALAWGETDGVVKNASEMPTLVTRFVLNADEWSEFLAALDRPPRDLPELRRFLQEPGPFDKGGLA